MARDLRTSQHRRRETWQYNLTERIGGRPNGTYALVPIVYSIVAPSDRGSSQDDWQGYVAGPVHQIPWDLGQGDPAIDPASRLANGEAAALDSRFRLVDDVVGKIL